MTAPERMRTEVLPFNPAAIARAVVLLQSGSVVAIPTETVYGLAARADDSAAVRRIFEAKGRPSTNPLIVRAADCGQPQLAKEAAGLLAISKGLSLNFADDHINGPGISAQATRASSLVRARVTICRTP